MMYTLLCACLLLVSVNAFSFNSTNANETQLFPTTLVPGTVSNMIFLDAEVSANTNVTLLWKLVTLSPNGTVVDKVIWSHVPSTVNNGLSIPISTYYSELLAPCLLQEGPTYWEVSLSELSGNGSYVNGTVTSTSVETVLFVNQTHTVTNTGKGAYFYVQTPDIVINNTSVNHTVWNANISIASVTGYVPVSKICVSKGACPATDDSGCEDVQHSNSTFASWRHEQWGTNVTYWIRVHSVVGSLTDYTINVELSPTPYAEPSSPAGWTTLQKALVAAGIVVGIAVVGFIIYVIVRRSRRVQYQAV